MRRLLTVVFFGFGLLNGSTTFAANVTKVFACEPEWASLVDAIGGQYVKTYVATNAKQDPHYIRARPSLMAKMRGSDLLVCSGADLEVGWLPILLQKSGAAGVQPNSEFYLMAADVVPVLEKQETVDRSMGDIHPAGNPHVHLNPHNILLVAQAINERLQKLDLVHAAAIHKQYEDFVARWSKAITKWESEAAKLKGKPIITHHKSWSYLIDWLGLTLVDTLESKPGIPPGSRQLEQLLRKARDKSVLAIIRTPYDPDDASEWLSSKTAVPAVELPFTVGGTDKSVDLFSLYDQTLDQLYGVLDGQ